MTNIQILIDDLARYSIIPGEEDVTISMVIPEKYEGDAEEIIENDGFTVVSKNRHEKGVTFNVEKK